MKQWLRREVRDENKRSRSKSHTREFRQEITKLDVSQPTGHFLAYCLISKESSTGLCLNERLLLLDTYRRELRYYSHIPSLPLNHPNELPSPKQTLHLKADSLIQFLPQKVRIGHVRVSWTSLGIRKNWKIIMGSNKIAKQFQQLVAVVLQKENDELKLIKENQFRKRQQSGRVKKQSIFQETPVVSIDHDHEIRYSTSSHHTNQIIKQANQSKESTLIDSVMMQPKQYIFETPAPQVGLQFVSFSQEPAPRTRLFSQSQRLNFQNNSFNPLQMRTRPQQKRIPIKTENLMKQWASATSKSQKASIYNRFLQKCIRKVQNIMQGFMTSHLLHKSDKGLCILEDVQVDVLYFPLIDSGEDEGGPDILAYKIKEEQRLLRQWQCFSFLSKYDRSLTFDILTPLSCVLTYKSFKFYCKHSIDQLVDKTIITNIYLYKEQIQNLEKQCHLKLLNGQQEIFQVQLGGRTLLYFHRLYCLPQVANLYPISIQYLEQYVKTKVISSQKDLQMIIEHMNMKLIEVANNQLHNKIISSPIELMNDFQAMGLTQHLLPHLISTNGQYSYFDRIVISEMIACAMEWEIRRKMQIQFFRKRQFGFALNQLKMTLSLLLERDSFFLIYLQKLVLAYFSFHMPDSVKLSNLIFDENVLISVMQKLGFDCKINFYNETELQNWRWGQQKLTQNVEFSALINIASYRLDCFNTDAESIYKILLSNDTYEINPEMPLSSVLNFLNITEDKNKMHMVSAEYLLLSPSTRRKINFYLSHFIAPHPKASVYSLQHQIYVTQNSPHFNLHPLQYLTALNQVRWLTKEKNFRLAEIILESEIIKAKIWKQETTLIQLYSFYSKLKLKEGEITEAQRMSLQSLQLAINHHETQPTGQVQLLIAEQAYESANLHFSIHSFSKALELYTTAEQILDKIKQISKNEELNTLNPEFLQLYVKKCSIALVFGDYKMCEECCLAGLACSKQIGVFYEQTASQIDFELYCLLFRCYQVNNMRSELTRVANLCSVKYLEGKVDKKEHIEEQTAAEIIKMLWLSIIKRIEGFSTTEQATEAGTIKYVYLKKVRKQLINLKAKLNDEHRYTRLQIIGFLSRKISDKQTNEEESKLSELILRCLAEVTLHSKGFRNDRLFSKESEQSEMMMLESLAIMAGYDFLIGSIENHLHLYRFQY